MASASARDGLAAAQSSHSKRLTEGAGGAEGGAESVFEAGRDFVGGHAVEGKRIGPGGMHGAQADRHRKGSEAREHGEANGEEHAGVEAALGQEFHGREVR